MCICGSILLIINVCLNTASSHQTPLQSVLVPASVHTIEYHNISPFLAQLLLLQLPAYSFCQASTYES